MVVVGVVPDKPRHLPRVRGLAAQLTLGPQLDSNVDVLKLGKRRDEAAMGCPSILGCAWRHRELMSPIPSEDGGGPVAGVLDLPLPVSLPIAPLLARGERVKVLGQSARLQRFHHGAAARMQ